MERKIKFASGEYYHVYSRGVEKRKIFLHEKDYERFIALMYIMNQKNPFNFANFLKFHNTKDIFNEKRNSTLVSVLSYALMPNHFHILLYEHTENGISKFMLRLLTAYSMYFNTKYQRSGPLFVRPFRAEHISSDSQYLWIFSYIHLNPVGLIKKNFNINNQSNVSKAEKFLNQYQYSSYIDYQEKHRAEASILDFSLIPQYLKHKKFDTLKYAKWLEIKNIEGNPQY